MGNGIWGPNAGCCRDYGGATCRDYGGAAAVLWVPRRFSGWRRSLLFATLQLVDMSAPCTAQLRGESGGGDLPVGRWGVDKPAPKVGKLRPSQVSLPKLGPLLKEPLMGGRRSFYGRGCSVVDIDGDGHEDLFLSNADNYAAQELFGAGECSSRVYLSQSSSGKFSDVAMEGWDTVGARKRRPRRKSKAKKTFTEDDLAKFKVKDLKALLAAHGLDTKGAKAALVARLLESGIKKKEPSPTGIDPSATVSQWGQVFFDMDNDGDQDLVLLDGGYEGPHPLKLYENVGEGEGDSGGYFRDVTKKAGLVGDRFRQFWWGGSAADYDNDGLLDLALTPLNAMMNYRVHREEGRNSPPDPTFTLPRDRFFLLHNQGDGTFKEESALVGVILGSLELGIDAGISETKNPVWIDLENDGDLDLYVAGSPHFLFENQGCATSASEAGAFLGFADVTHSHILAPQHSDKLVFAAAAADFDQDGRVDLFLGYWNSAGSDVVLRNGGNGVLGAKNGEGGWRVGDVTISKLLKTDSSKAVELQKTSEFGIPTDEVYENTMGLAVGDLNDDGFPDAWIGTGTPAWSEHDLLWINAGLGLHEQVGAVDGASLRNDAHSFPDAGWRGFTKRIVGANDQYGTPDTHGHGAAFGDFDRNWHTDLLLNPGGFALTDTYLAKTWSKRHRYKCEQRGELGVCDSREMPVIYFGGLTKGETALQSNSMAAIRLQGRFSNRDAIGAHVELLLPRQSQLSSTPTGGSNVTANHWWVHSTNGFQSQNSAWILLPLGSRDHAEVKITWPRGHISFHKITEWSREVLLEPDAAGPLYAGPSLRVRATSSHVADHALVEENRVLKQRLADAGSVAKEEL